jgi:hypothetical protein
VTRETVALSQRSAPFAETTTPREGATESDPLVERIMRIGVGVAVAGVVVQVLSQLLNYFSLDDIARFHEEIAYSFREDVLGVQLAYGRIIWPIMFLPLLAAAFILLWRFAERTSESPGRAIRISLVMLVLAVFAEAFSTVFHVGDDPEGTLQDILQVAVEESLELAAWVLIAAAAAATLCKVLIERGRTERA